VSKNDPKQRMSPRSRQKPREEKIGGTNLTAEEEAQFYIGVMPGIERGVGSKSPALPPGKIGVGGKVEHLVGKCGKKEEMKTGVQND